jgi:cation:H+ antiporter
LAVSAQIAERTATEQLHHQQRWEMIAGERIVDRHHVFVVQGRCRPSFTHQSLMSLRRVVGTILEKSSPGEPHPPLLVSLPKIILNAWTGSESDGKRRTRMNEHLWAGLNVAVGLTIMVGGAELLVRGASKLAVAMRISPLVIGLTVVAFGTSAPELAVSVQAALTGSADLALGNVVGSNIFNVLFILGLSAMIVPLVVSSQLIRWDVPIMIAVSFALLGMSLDGMIDRGEGFVLSAGIVAYTWWCIRLSRKESAAIAAEFAQEWPPEAASPRSMLVNLILIIAGLCLLGLGSRLLIAGSVRIAEYLGISQLVIGLTIVAAGTSLPEVVTSIVAAIRGERDIAVGNVVGSNIFNILCVLGVASVLGPAGVGVSPAALAYDIPVMIAVAVACLPIFLTGNLISRWEGGLFFFYYLAYTTYLVTTATGSQFADPLRDGMLFFVIPLTTLTLAVTACHGLRQGQVTEVPPATPD